MEDLFGINACRKAVAENIQKAFGSGYETEGTDENINIQKARSGVYADNAKNRRLNRVGQAYGHKKQEEMPKGKVSTKIEDEPSDKKGTSEKQDMSSHAAKASDGALKRAAADEKAPEDVRNAAKEELKKRGNGSEDNGVKKVDNSKGNEKAWNSVFKKLKHAENSDDMYDNLWELGQKYDVDLDDYGDEEEMLKVIKEKIPYHEVANVINGGNDEKQWNSVFKRMKHAGDFSDDMYDNLWELGQKYDIDLDDYGDEEEMFKVIKNNIPIKEVQNVVSKYKRF